MASGKSADCLSKDRESAFEINSATAKNVAIANHSSKGIERPLFSFDANYVGVSCQQHRFPRSIAPEARHKMSLARQRCLHDADLKTKRMKASCQKVGDFAFVSRRIAAVNLNELRKQIGSRMLLGLSARAGSGGEG